jgi:hypothetical protein
MYFPDISRQDAYIERARAVQRRRPRAGEGGETTGAVAKPDTGMVGKSWLGRLYRPLAVGPLRFTRGETHY